jgi:hypothetical protein
LPYLATIVLNHPIFIFVAKSRVTYWINFKSGV